MKTYRSRILTHTHSVVPALMLALFAALPITAAHADDWALLIGIDRYQDGAEKSGRIPPLLGAVNDVRALAKTLEETSGFPPAHIVLLTSGDATHQPTREAILGALSRLTELVKTGDTVFVFYAGHGMFDSETGTDYLLPYDTNVRSVRLLKDTALPVDKFTEYLRNLPAKLLVIALDKCRVEIGRGGIGTESEQTQNGRALAFKSSATQTAAPNAATTDGPQIVVKWFSCSPNQRSYEDGVSRRGYFAYYLEQGLRGQAASGIGKAVTLADLGRWVGPAVEREVKKREGEAQTPRLAFEGVASLDALAGIAMTTRPLPHAAAPTEEEGTVSSAANATLPALAALVPGILTEARETAETVSQPISKAHILTMMAEAEARSGDLIAAKKTIDSATETAANIADDDHRKPEVLSRIARAQFRAGDRTGAAKTLGTAGQIALRFASDQWKAVALDEVARVQAETKDNAGARKTVETIRTIALKTGYPIDPSSVLATVASVQAGTGDNVGARKTLAQIALPWFAIAAQCGIARAEYAAGDTATARRTIAAAETAAKKLDNALDRSAALRDIVAAQAGMGDLTAASENAQKIVQPDSKLDALTTLAAAQARAGDAGAAESIRAALRVAAATPEYWQQTVGLPQIAEAQARAGDLAEARAIAARLTDSAVKAMTLARIAAAVADTAPLSH